MMATKAHVRPIQLKGNARRVALAELVQLLQTWLTRFLLRYKVNIMRSVGSFSQFFHSWLELAATVRFNSVATER